ncbi:hypothetical protein JNM05_16530 [bacterium]|nr:hypothetical protein [bacterium]
MSTALNKYLVILFLSFVMVSCESNELDEFQPSSVTIKFSLPSPATVTLIIQNSYNTTIRSLRVKESLPAGYHTSVWNGTDDNEHLIPEGIYFYVLEIDIDGNTSKFTRMIQLTN